jgi:hypothetical protein
VNYQIYTRKMGVDGAPIQLTSEAWDHLYPAVSGDRVAWQGSITAAPQVFRAKLVTTPTVTRSPNKNAVTLKRTKGVIAYMLSAVVRDRDGTLVAGKPAYLQTSRNGTTWKNTYSLKTNASGRATKTFKSRTRSTLYYRWSVPASPGYRKAFSARQKVTVK